MNKVISAVAGLVLRYKDISMELARIETAKAYLQTVRAVRTAVLLIYVLFVFILMTFFMLAMAHAAVFIMAGDKTNAVLLLLGFDALLVLMMIGLFSSQKIWMKLSRSHQWFQDSMETEKSEQEHQGSERS